MQQYKYPIRHFGGAALELLPSKLLNSALNYFEEKLAFESPILGATGIDDVLIDFNDGLRLQIPRGNFHVRIVDTESDFVFLYDDIEATTLISMEKFYVEWEIAIWKDGEPVFCHQFDPRGQRVHFLFAPPLGDNIALLPYVEEFRRTFDCKVSCTMPPYMREIVSAYFPGVELTNELTDDIYATYYMFAITNMPFAAVQDSRTLPLELIGRAILNTPKINCPPKVIYTPTKPREIPEPYVCIGVQASMTSKGWLNPNGWDEVVEYLNSLGYRVLCIDRNRKCSDQLNTIEQPRGVEDMSGGYTLIERVNQLAYADFFVGLSSGLSWLAWAVGIPVVMISGITEPWYEFDSAYRVSNPLVCHGCFNDMRVDFNSIARCASYKGTARAFECSKQISARQVINAIDRLITDRNLMGGNDIDSSD